MSNWSLGFPGLPVHERQKRHETGPLDGLSQLALVLGAGAALTLRHDLRVRRGVATQRINVFIVDILDAVDAEVAVTAGGLGRAGAAIPVASVGWGHSE